MFWDADFDYSGTRVAMKGDMVFGLRFPGLKKVEVNVLYFGDSQEDFIRKWSADLEKRNEGVIVDIKAEMG
jgi:hypothetical protein